MTFNLANYDDHDNVTDGFWSVRLQMFADIICENLPDIISFQEVRFNPDNCSTQLLYQNMAEQILYELNLRGKYIGSTILIQPVMYYNTTNNVYTFPAPSLPTPRFQDALCKWEGLSIISNSTVNETGSRFLSIVNNADTNKRSVKSAIINTLSGQTLYVFNCHYSYNIDNFQKNVEETIEYMKPFLQYPCLLMGDMNQTEENSDEDIAEKVKESFDLFRNEGLYDVWQQLNPDDPGYTDRTESQRIDYMWANFSNIDSIHRVGMVPDKQGVYASDHYGLILKMNN